MAPVAEAFDRKKKIITITQIIVFIVLENLE